MNRLIAIVGPTGVGKSRLAIKLAQTFNGEIVSADSRQVYRYMDIGTAKPAPEELSRVPHHLISIIDPDEDFSLAQYQKLAYDAIHHILQRGKLPFLVGGTGLYVWSVLEGWEIPAVPPDTEYRRSLEEKASRIGKLELYQELVKVDPAAAEKIDPRNVRRTIRALEVHRSRQSVPSRPGKKEPPFDTLIIGLTAERQELYRMIDARVDKMVEQGLVEEVEALVKRGYDFTLPSMSGIGYRQIGMFLRGELTLDAAIEKIKTETHRFVRQQYNWFRLEDERIHWFDMGDEEAEAAIRKMIADCHSG
ncbi:MAG: tRNA (adenosine(37)-N6)-dimethylallyltransferase MiaA [Chloroflexi bacterium]|nr:tRNA (adenosine(37)-N6)-dimethylallyltransferase MiaA [Chloroflexota bacterium]